MERICGREGIKAEEKALRLIVERNGGTSDPQ
jgi:DNA polymerase III gamma/tau subunit